MTWPHLAKSMGPTLPAPPWARAPATRRIRTRLRRRAKRRGDEAGATQGGSASSEDSPRVGETRRPPVTSPSMRTAWGTRCRAHALGQPQDEACYSSGMRRVLGGLTALVVLGACNAGAPPLAAPAPPPPPVAPLATASNASPPPDAAAPPSDATAPLSDTTPAPAPASEPPPAPKRISCTTVDDCWFDDQYAPIARPKKLRGKKITPCKGGHERVPACQDGVCAVIGYKC